MYLVEIERIVALEHQINQMFDGGEFVAVLQPQIIPIAELRDLTIPANVPDAVLICAAVNLDPPIRARCITVGAFRYWLQTLQRAN